MLTVQVCLLWLEITRVRYVDLIAIRIKELWNAREDFVRDTGSKRRLRGVLEENGLLH